MDEFDWKLEFYGSCVNGLMTSNKSDIDLVLFLNKNEKVATVDNYEFLKKIEFGLIQKFPHYFTNF